MRAHRDARLSSATSTSALQSSAGASHWDGAANLRLRLNETVDRYDQRSCYTEFGAVLAAGGIRTALCNVQTPA
jgi:hypothetical protein